MRSSCGTRLLVLGYALAVGAPAHAQWTCERLRSFGIADGNYPGAPLLEASDGMLYGSTSEGGIEAEYGTIFRLRPDGSEYEVVHRFTWGDGAYPYGALLEGGDGVLYGTASKGGNSGLGTVYKLDGQGGSLQVLHSFIGVPGESYQLEATTRLVNPAWMPVDTEVAGPDGSASCDDLTARHYSGRFYGLAPLP